MPRDVEIPPSSLCLTESIRDIGYSVETAVADIIDNSISAKASNINIRFTWNSGNPWLAIIDDGCGMGERQLISSMRLGANNPRNSRKKNDLGRFGLGLKTASFSQCRMLTVLSLKDSKVSCCRWDLDKIQNPENEWKLTVFSEEDISKFDNLLDLKKTFLHKKKSGTIVFLENIDRLMEQIASHENKFNEVLSNVKTHLELVFHRFISPDKGKDKINFYFNLNPLKAFDPFNTKMSTELRNELFRFEGEFINVQPYILPHHNKVSKSNWEKYKGKFGYLHNQGFYVYRNRRLIINSTWFRLIPKTELTKLLRVKIDISNSLDHLWKIDIKKSNAYPPEGIRDALKQIIGRIESSGKKVYHQRGHRRSSRFSIPIWNRVDNKGQISYLINREHPSVENFRKSLPKCSEKELMKLIKLFESTYPKESLFYDLTSNPELSVNSNLEKSQLENLLEMFINDSQPDTSKERLREILQVDPFSSYKDIVEQIFRERNYEF